MDHFKQVKSKVNALSAIGIQCTPFDPMGKFPKGGNWDRAHTLPFKPGDNIGILGKYTNLLVIDIDRASDSDEDTNKMEELHERLCNTFPDDFLNAPSEKSPSGGYHYFFNIGKDRYDETKSSVLTRYEDGVEVEKLGIDVRGTKGICVISPSKYGGSCGNAKKAWKDQFKGQLYEEINPFTPTNLQPISEELSHMLTSGKCVYTEDYDELFLEVYEAEDVDEEKQSKKFIEDGCGIVRDERSFIIICEKLAGYHESFSDNQGWQSMTEALIACYGSNVDQDVFIENWQAAADPHNQYETENTNRIIHYLNHKKGDGAGSLINKLKSLLGDEEFKAFMFSMSNEGLWVLPNKMKPTMTFECIEDITKLTKNKKNSFTNIAQYVRESVRYNINSGSPMYIVRSRNAITGNIGWVVRTPAQYESFSKKQRIAVEIEEEDTDGNKVTSIKRYTLFDIIEVPSIMESIIVDASLFIPHAPGKEPVIKGKIVNLFRGYKAQPFGDMDLLGDEMPKDNSYVQLFVSHIKDIWCKGDTEMGEHVLKWFSHILQRPNIPTESAIVVVGKEGAGKGSISNVLINHILGRELGRNYEGISRYLDKFETAKEKLLLAVLDESNTSGMDKASIDKLKHIITDRTLEIEYKGVQSYNVDLYNNLLFTTNNYSGLRITPNDRRFTVLEISDSKIGDFSYFDKLNNPSDYEASCLVHYLLNDVDLTGYNPRAIIKTVAKHEMAINQLNGPQRLLMSWYNDEQSGMQLTDNQSILKEGNTMLISPQSIYTYYKNVYAGAEGIKAITGANNFKRQLTDILGATTKGSKTDRRMLHRVTTNQFEDLLKKSIGPDLHAHMDNGNRPWIVEEQQEISPINDLDSVNTTDLDNIIHYDDDYDDIFDDLDD